MRSLNRAYVWCIGAMLVVAVAAVSAYWMMLEVSLPAPTIIESKGGPAAIVSDVGGLIQRVYVTDGSVVHAGDVLVQLDTRDLVRKRQILESQIHWSELQHKACRLELARLYRDLQRTQLELVRYTITSPADGRIMTLVNRTAGKRVLPGTAIGIVAVRPHSSQD